MLGHCDWRHRQHNPCLEANFPARLRRDSALVGSLSGSEVNKSRDKTLSGGDGGVTQAGIARGCFPCSHICRPYRLRDSAVQSWFYSSAPCGLRKQQHGDLRVGLMWFDKTVRSTKFLTQP